jgi:kynurenine formamidase
LLDAAAFRALAERLRTLPAVEPPDAARVLAGVRLVSKGRVVSTADGPAEPALASGAEMKIGESSPYRLTQWTDDGPDWSAVNDRIELDVHGAPSMTHVDTTEHFTWNGEGAPSGPDGALVEIARTGAVGRGVLIDVPNLVGPVGVGDVVTLHDVRTALSAAGIEPRVGDALYFSFGRRDPARSDVALGTEPTPGLSIECAEWLAGLRPSMIVTDYGLDSFPSEVDGCPVPWHLLVLTVLKIPLVDRAELTALSRTCAELDRWEFLSVLAPLPIPHASGSPVNPLALF